MFGIVDLHRPRRFVELGSHHGASFFAACQAVKQASLDCECVAVDHWRGDAQAGFFSDDVFEGFRTIVEKDFGSFATYVRDDFDGASARFDGGSIDLLHIDGFHSYDAVRHDFETWRPKLSSRGVVLFHDVNEHQADFGVWRYWRELERDHAGRTLFFGQSHGLGLLSLDSDASSPVNELIRSCEDPANQAFIQHFLTSVAALNSDYQAVIHAEREGRVRELYDAHVDHQGAMAQAHEEFGRRLAAELGAAESTRREEVARYEARLGELGERLRAEAERQRAALSEQAVDNRARIRELTEKHAFELAAKTSALEAAEHDLRQVRELHVNELLQTKRAYESSRSWRATRLLRLPSDIRHRGRKERSVAVAPELRIYFDPQWYSAQLGVEVDLPAAIAHYQREGRAQGLSPHPLFDPVWYQGQLGDSPPSDLFLHYLRYGQTQGLEPHPCFDSQLYRSQVGEDTPAHARPFEHYLNDRGAWRLRPHELFDGSWYLAANPDVANAGVNPLVHYLMAGEKERRRPNPEFEPAWYRAQYGDVLGERSSELADFAARRSPRGTEAAKLAARDDALDKLAVFLGSGRRGSLVSSTAPVVTVAIAVWNQAHFTLQCLESLVGCQTPLRVVVVDNASTDSTAELLSRWRGVEVIRNTENVGFLRATNQVLGIVDTPYVLLLNNDARVRAGSIERAIEVLEETHAGAVAAKVVLPNGLLQEAGSFLWSDASAQGYLRGEPWRTPPSMHRREVDFGSGAFLMMRSGPVRELAGLDEAYLPAYYEEVDLCMRLTRSGWPTVYEPSVVIDHVEFGSSPDQKSAIQLQIDHRHLVAERFRDELEGRPAAGAVHPDVMANWAHRDRPGVVLVDDRLPVGWEGSGLPRAEALTTAIAEVSGRNVFLAPMVEQPDLDWRSVSSVLERGVEVHPEYGDRAMDRALSRIAGRYDTIVISRFHNLLRIEKLIAERPDLFRNVRVVYDSEAVGVKRERLQAAVLGRPWSSEKYREMLEREMRAARLADTVLAVTESDAAVFRDAGCADVHLVSHAVSVRRGSRSAAGRDGLLFVGRLHEMDSPNVDSLKWFLDECFETLRVDRRVALTVVGKTSATVRTELQRPGVRLRGPIPDIDSAFDSARVFVAPTRFAAGTPIKVLTAAAAGIPVVCTTVLAEQLGWVPGHELQVADSPDEFSTCVDRLLTDDALWEAQRDAAFDRVESEYSKSRFQDSVRRFLGERRG